MTSNIPTARTLLFVPGNKPDLFGKAASAGADGYIADLEDAVAPADKIAARTLALEGINAWPGIVRINAAGTTWHDDDVPAVARAQGVEGVMLPMAESRHVVATVARHLGGIPLILLVESARGIRDAAEMAAVEGVTRLAFGNLDFALDAGIEPRSEDEDELLYARSALSVASRAAGLPGPIDGVLGDFKNDDLLRRRTTRAWDLGFRGKLCIHPRQVAVVHDAVRPSAEEIHWARRIVDGAGHLEGAAVQVDGEMVDRPVLLKARDLLARASD